MTEHSTSSSAPGDVREALDDALSLVETTSTFATGNFAKSLPLPSLSVTGVGQIPLPLQPSTAAEISKVSEQAPFGKGADTVVDTTVRNCRQVDAKDVVVGDAWRDAVQHLAAESAATLGVASANVVSSLYKLILYPKGGFFTKHKDTEKEKGMFATMVVQLPSKYTGGCLVVRHRDEEKRFDFAAQSDVSFHFAAFYADCDHELLPVTDGYRLCLIYNLLRLGEGPLPSVKEHDAVFDRLIAAVELWQNDVEPRKLAVQLEHQYTKANLAFRNLKGRDAAIGSVLKRCRQFELHLALVEKYVRGAAAYDGYSHRRRYGGWGDEEEESGAHHEMEDIIDQSVEVLKWVSQDDQTANLGKLSVDEEDMLGDEALFDEDENPDKEEYESYTGNAGPTVEYWYYRAVLVMWPRARSVSMACSGSFAAAVQLAMRRAQEGAKDMHQVAEEVVSFADKHPSKAQGRLAGLLEVACAVKHLGLIHRVLPFMSRAVVRESHSYVYRCEPAAAGCWSAKHSSSILTAIKMFGWKELGPLVLGAVKVTPGTHVGHCAVLACALQAQASPETSEGAHAIAKEACNVMLGAKLQDAAAPSCAKMVFLIDSCSEQKAAFLARANELSAATLAEVLQAIHKSCRTTPGQAFPTGFLQLVNAYMSRALRKNDFAQSSKHIALVWAILLGPTPRNDTLLDNFCKAVIAAYSGPLLRELLGTGKSKTMVSDPFVTRIATARSSQLRYAKPQYSHRQPHALVPNHPRVTEFLRSNSTSLEYLGFNGIRHARNFAAKHFHGIYNAQEKHSARAAALGRGQDAYVVIKKTDAVYDTALQQYKRDQAELAHVVRHFLRFGSSSVDGSGIGDGKEMNGSSESIIDLTVNTD